MLCCVVLCCFVCSLVCCHCFTSCRFAWLLLVLLCFVWICCPVALCFGLFSCFIISLCVAMFRVALFCGALHRAAIFCFCLLCVVMLFCALPYVASFPGDGALLRFWVLLRFPLLYVGLLRFGLDGFQMHYVLYVTLLCFWICIRCNYVASFCWHIALPFFGDELRCLGWFCFILLYVVLRCVSCILGAGTA